MERPHGKAQHRARREPGEPAAALRDRQGGGGEDRRRRHRGDDVKRRPGRIGGHLQRGHADIMFRRRAKADRRPAERRGEARLAIDDEAEAAAEERRADDQRQGGERDVESEIEAWPISENGDEMGRPDAECRRRTGRDDAQRPKTARRLDAFEELNGGETGEQANARRQNQQAPIVLGGEADEDAVHTGSN